MMEIEQLWQEIDGRVARLPSERASLLRAAGRVVTENIVSPVDQPAFDQSAMDGFVFASTRPGTCRIAGTIAAGGAPVPIAPGTAVRIFTGAVVPKEAAAIAKQEDCEWTGERVSLLLGKHLVEGENIRRCGAIYRKGGVLLESGSLILQGTVALLASAGIDAVDSVRRASALHLVTGDEIVPPGQKLLPGRTYDSNGPMIAALLAGAGVETERRYLGDDADSQQIRTWDGDLLLISGGSGSGDRDHTLHMLESAGYAIHASRINSRPGKPLIFATRGAQVAFGLPGNPLSHWVCFHAFVKRAIHRLHGLPGPEMISVHVAGPEKMPGDARRTWSPGYGKWGENGLEVRPLPWKHSGDLTPLASANALLLEAGGDGTARTFLL